MIVEDVHAAIAALLTTDATFTAALTASIASGGCGLPRVPTNVLSNRPNAEIEQLHVTKLPCWVMEPINGEALPDASSEFGLTIGSGQQAFRFRVVVSLFWRETDRDIAYRQRVRIPERIAQLFLRADTLGLPDCAGAIVRAVEPDQGGTHPHHILSVEINADVYIRPE
jgi:hypothetical protein